MENNNLNLKYLSYFIEIVKRESFTKAAEETYVSQSALSKAVKCLEQSLGVTLIDRTNKSFHLTEEGRILYVEGQKLLRYIEERKTLISEQIHRSSKKLRVGIPPVISTAYFSYLIYKYREQFQEVSLEVIEVGANTVQSMVDQGDVDIGVVILPVTHPEQYNIYSAMSSENVLIVNINHPFAAYSEISFKDLKNEKFLILDGTYMLHDKIITNCGIAGFYPNITTESSQWDFLAEMVALNQGISILPKPIVERFYSGHRIRMIRLREPDFPWNVAMIIKEGKVITDQMKNFVKLVIENKSYVKGYI